MEITKGTRVINFLIDVTIIVILHSYLSSFLLFHLDLSLLYYGIYFMYYFLFEFFNKGQTLGKKITSTKVVTLNNQKPSFIRIFWRTFLRLNPFDTISYLCGQNGHDSVSRTKLISSKFS